jgi:hypothetical protein
VTVARWAMNTGCPLIGVWLPSFLGKSGITLVFTNWDACSLMLSTPLAAMQSQVFFMTIVVTMRGIMLNKIVDGIRVRYPLWF